MFQFFEIALDRLFYYVREAFYNDFMHYLVGKGESVKLKSYFCLGNVG